MGPKTKALVEYVRRYPGCSQYDAAMAVWHSPDRLGVAYRWIKEAIENGYLTTVDGTHYIELFDATQCGVCGRSDHDLADALADGTMCQPGGGADQEQAEGPQAMPTASSPIELRAQALRIEEQMDRDAAEGIGRDNAESNREYIRILRDTASAYEDERSPFSNRTDKLASAKPIDRPLYAWVCEGEVSIGTLDSYASAQESAHYSWVSVSDRLTTLNVGRDGGVDAREVLMELKRMGQSADDEGYPSHAYYRIVLRDNEGRIIDAADYGIDLRA